MITDNWLHMYLKLLVLMYAYDTDLLLADSEEGIKNTLRSLENYCNDWNSEVNCDEAKFVMFRAGKTQIEGHNLRKEMWKP